MTDKTLLGPWVRRFLVEHLIGERNLAPNTQKSYRDTLTLLLPFVGKRLSKPLERLTVEDLDAVTVQRFLEHIEEERRCTVATRNQRLAAIHALGRFIGEHSPEHLAWYTTIRAIPFKKTPKPTMAYLDKPEVEAILDMPNRKAAQGPRDHALLLFLYNTGARVEEAARLTVADLVRGSSPAVRLVGKGGKVRYCPLWEKTVTALDRIIAGRAPHEPVFLNRRSQRMTRFGIHALIKRFTSQASQRVVSLKTKCVSAHTFRHTTAVHLLRSGVDLNTIRAWLGHVSLDTTNVYAEVDLQMKAEALAHCEVPDGATPKRWRKEPELMAFLKGLGRTDGAKVMLSNP